MKNLIFFVFNLILCSAMVAQSGVITGRVIDETLLPLPGATVSVDGHPATVTDQHGSYFMTNITAGSHNVEVSFIGYQTMIKEVEVFQGQNTALDFSLEPGVSLNEIVVTSVLRGQARALNNQLSRDNITNIIAADQIGRFPDANIGDAIKRVPGINVQYDQGEARFGNIRGTAPQLNSVMINGERIPSAEAEVRSIQLDLIPSDMVQTVEVSKAITPDMDADAIGGAVNLVTRAAPYERRISGTLGAGYNTLANEPTFNGSLIIGDRFAGGKLGVIASASYFDNNLGSDNVEAEWTYDDANDNDQFDDGEASNPEEIQIRQYYLQRNRQSYSLSLDYKINPSHTVFLKGIYNRRKDWENRYRSVFTDIENNDGQWVAELERQTKAGTEDIKYARLEDQTMMNFALSGEHIFGKMRATWSANYAEASEDRPNERYYEIVTDGQVPVSADFSDTERPNIAAVDPSFRNPSSSWELSEITEEFQFTNDQDVNARLDFILPIGSGSRFSQIKFGGRLRTKAKLRDNNFFEYEPTDDMVLANSFTAVEDLTKDDYLAGDYTIGAFTTPAFVGDLDLTGGGFEQEQDLSELAGNFEATEAIYGAYGMLEHELTSKLKVIAGVRLEQTDLSYQGFTFDDQEESLTETAEVNSNYLNVLPGLHLRYNVSPRTVLRLAYTNTLARPNYFDLVPYREIEDGEELSIGNPDLNATTSVNFDFMAEHYFGNVGLLSGGVFYKSIDDFIVNQTFDDYQFEGTEWASFSQPINGGSAALLGFEAAFQRQLDFISPSLSGLSVYFNYTYINSEVTDFNFEGREDDEIALPGSPEHTLNASLAYEGKRFTTRASLNFASDFIEEVGEEAFYDVSYDQVTYIDLNASYSINDRWIIYANANNLLDQPLRFFQGNSGRTFQAEYYGPRFDMGVKFDISN